jgi:hypothetical protein
MAHPLVCEMCGRPILEADYQEGYQKGIGRWEPLHKRCAESLSALARQTGQGGPALREGFARVPAARGNKTCP